MIYLKLLQVNLTMAEQTVQLPLQCGFAPVLQLHLLPQYLLLVLQRPNEAGRLVQRLNSRWLLVRSLQIHALVRQIRERALQYAASLLLVFVVFLSSIDVHLLFRLFLRWLRLLAFREETSAGMMMLRNGSTVDGRLQSGQRLTLVEFDKLNGILLIVRLN